MRAPDGYCFEEMGGGVSSDGILVAATCKAERCSNYSGLDGATHDKQGTGTPPEYTAFIRRILFATNVFIVISTSSIDTAYGAVRVG